MLLAGGLLLRKCQIVAQLAWETLNNLILHAVISLLKNSSRSESFVKISVLSTPIGGFFINYVNVQKSFPQFNSLIYLYIYQKIDRIF